MKSRKDILSSNSPVEAPDRLSSLLEQFRVRAALFHSGALCGTTTFEPRPGRAFLHVLRRGAMEVRHPDNRDLERSMVLREPTLLLYPRPLRHVFMNPPQDGPDFTCATLDFDGGDGNPFVRALPAFVRVSLSEVEGLTPALDLLYSEADRVRCGSRLLVNRLFEIVLIQLLRWIVDHPDRIGVTSGLIAGLSEPRLARSLVALHQAPDEPWPLARMARVAGMSRSAFAEAFKTVTGTTPAAYLTDWRLTLAASMLDAGKPVKRIAAELGFASASSLSKSFKQRVGVCPRDWLGSQAGR